MKHFTTLGAAKLQSAAGADNLGLLIFVCSTYGLQWDIQFNCKKSHILCFGTGTRPKQDTIRM